MKAIGRQFGKEGGSVYGQLAPYGGIRPRATLSLAAGADSWLRREEISRGVAAGQIDAIDLPDNWGVRHRQSVGRSAATEVAVPIGQPRPRSVLGVEHDVPDAVGLAC